MRAFLTTVVLLLPAGVGLSAENWPQGSTLDWLKENNDRVVQTGHAQIPWQRDAPPQGRNGTSLLK